MTSFSWIRSRKAWPSLLTYSRASALSYDQHRARCEMHDAVCSTAHHAVIERRMTAGADHEQIGFEITRKIDDVPHRMAGDHVSFQLNLIFFRHCA